MKFDNLTTLFIFISCLKVELFFSLPVNSETEELSIVFHIYVFQKENSTSLFFDRVHERKKTVT